jgi:DNA polymerase III alpha subunit
MPDIDIDFADRSVVLDKLKYRSAILEPGKKHNTGVYVTEIPHDPITKSATIDYKTAEDRGYFKLDFLNVSVYDKISSKQHLNKLMGTEPIWELLLEDDFVNKLFHVNGHGSILRQMKPMSIEQLAAILAMIRPAKRYLIGKDWNTVMSEVWVKPENDEYYFKKAHAIAYAHVIVVQMNLICEYLEHAEN